ncbi:MAG TPA: serine hydrolase domain-containing protein [Thermoanaerobaculia bacterium]
MRSIRAFLEAEIAEGTFPGAAALVGTADAIVALEAAGSAAVEPVRRDLTAETPFDLASLTKPLCVGAICREAARSLPLDAAPGRFLPEWKKSRFEGITLERLLTHTSGLDAWYPLYARGEGAAAYRRTLAEMEPVSPPGERVLYSDLNSLLLTEILEIALAAPLDRVFDELVARPARSGARFLPDAHVLPAATEKGDRLERAMTEARGLSYARFRDGVVCGEVHDGNAFRRGGVSGNAGLFGTAEDVWRLARRWLEPDAVGWAQDRTGELSEARGLAWQGRRGAGSAIPEMSPRSFGHTGFTGTSLWIDPGAADGGGAGEPVGRVAILLTNRIHPVVREIAFNEVRQRFHAAVWAA